MPNLTPKQRTKILKEKVKKSGLDIQVLSPTSIAIKMPKTPETNPNNKPVKK